jgi:hypothetical protein
MNHGRAGPSDILSLLYRNRFYAPIGLGHSIARVDAALFIKIRKISGL